MIRSLRRTHVVIFVLLAILLPVLFALGLFARRPIEIMKRVPEMLTSEQGNPHEP